MRSALLRLAVPVALVAALAAASAPRAATAPLVRHPARADSVPVVEVRGPTVVAFWPAPPSNAVLEEDEDLATALDDLMYYWAESRPQLRTAGIAPAEAPLPWDERRLVLAIDGRRVEVRPHADSADIGYVLARPGRAPYVLYGVTTPEELVDSARRVLEVAAAP